MDKQLTDSKVWGKRTTEGQVVELPSGFVVKLRPVTMDYMLLNGKLTDTLTPIVADIIATGGHAFTNIVEDAKKVIELKRLMCGACLLYPKLVDNPDYDNGEIGYDDIPAEDSEFIMSWALRPQKELASFRKEQEAPVGSVRNGEDV